jgi:hypothetical protein
MPSKSRRNRRNIPQKMANASPAAVNPASTGTDSTASAAQPERVTPRYNPTAKSSEAVAASYPYILGELKWIGLVTVIVVVVMVLLYIFLH